MKLKHKVQALESGLRLVTVPMAVPSITALVLVGVGSRFEEASVNGISHFFEHMVFKGTEKYPSALALSSVVDAVGAEFNAFTGKEYTGFYLKAGSAHLSLATQVLGEMLFKPRLVAEEMEREKGVIIEEINMYEDQPIRDIGNVFDSLLYSPSSLGWDVIGTKETIRGMNRDDFLKHMSKWYWPGNMVVGVAGDSKVVGDWSLVVSLINKYFIQPKVKNHQGRLRSWEKFSQEKPRVLVKHKKTEQAHFILGVRGLPRGHKDRYAMAVLSVLLGGNMSSRLFIEVRERRGLAYYVRSGVETYYGAGNFGVQAGVELKKIEEAVRVIVEELSKVRLSKGNGSISESEINKAKEYVKGRLVLDLEDSREVAGEYIEDLLLENKVRTPQEVIEGVDKVIVEDLRRLATELFMEKHLNLAVIGPYKDEGQFEKLLRL